MPNCHSTSSHGTKFPPKMPHNHQVLFYEDNAFPDTTIGDFLYQGLVQGDAVIVIATAANAAAIKQRFLSLGVDLEAVLCSGQLTLLDAHSTLELFQGPQGLIKPYFFERIGAVVNKASKLSSSGHGRAFGDMVGLLVDQGLPEAAIELENYWNDLLAFSNWELYCAYPIRQFANQGLAECFCQICDEHSNVIPLKTDMDIPAGHGRCVAVLQQQSKALNSEIAERKQIENALRQQQETLEETIRQRTQELTLAKEKAEAANHAKDLFLANISHELRTPLNAVLGYSQILGRDKNLNQQQRSGLWAIQSSGEHLLMMINDVLDLAKIEAGKIDLELTAVPLDNFLHVIADIIAIKAQQKSLTLQLEFADDLPSGVSIDEKRLRQILLNLLSNAVKFTDHGTVIFCVGHTDLADNKVELHFSVKDSGIGIDPTQQERIFLPFEQIHRDNIGTGLGLAISRQLADKMNSVLQVSSTQDTGSEFHFDLIAEKVEITQPLHKKLATELKFQWVGLTAPHTSSISSTLLSQDIMDNELTHLPPKADMQTLQQLAFMGDVIKLHKELARITQKDANYQSFTQKIDYLAKQYKTKDIVTLLTRYLT